MGGGFFFENSTVINRKYKKHYKNKKEWLYISKGITL